MRVQGVCKVARAPFCLPAPLVGGWVSSFLLLQVHGNVAASASSLLCHRGSKTPESMAGGAGCSSGAARVLAHCPLRERPPLNEPWNAAAMLDVLQSVGFCLKRCVLSD